MLLAGAAPATESSSALPGADAVGDPGDSAWSGARFRLEAEGGDAAPRWSGEEATSLRVEGEGVARGRRVHMRDEAPTWRARVVRR